MEKNQFVVLCFLLLSQTGSAPTGSQTTYQHLEINVVQFSHSQIKNSDAERKCLIQISQGVFVIGTIIS